MPTNIVPIQAQRRLAPAGEIRLGKKVNGTRKDGSEYSRPAKIDKFRLTSSDKARLDAAAQLYGGTVTAWEGKWELYTDVDVVPIVVIPHQALNVSYELWGQKTVDGKKTPVICLRRCDGENELKSDGPCLCARQEEMTCKPTARLSVVLTDIPGLGVWKLVTHGWNALTELQGTVELLEALVAVGRPVRARLRLEKRESPNEEGTRKFVVPVVDIDHTLGQVLDAIGQGMSPDAIDIGGGRELDQRSGMTPVPALAPGAQPSIADQVKAAGEIEKAPRSNAAEPIRGTGVQPRTVAELSGAAALVPDGDGEPGGSVPVAAVADPPPSPASGEGNGPSEAQVPPPDDVRGPSMPLPQRVAMWCNDAGLDDDGRHQFLAAFSKGAYASAKDVPPGDIVDVRAKLVQVKRGELIVGDQDGTPVLMWTARDQAPADAAGDPTLELWDADRWLAEIAPIAGVGQATLLKAARSLAAELGGVVPNTVGEITDPALVKAVRAWLGEKAAA